MIPQREIQKMALSQELHLRIFQKNGPALLVESERNFSKNGPDKIKAFR